MNETRSRLICAYVEKTSMSLCVYSLCFFLTVYAVPMPYLYAENLPTETGTTQDDQVVPADEVNLNESQEIPSGAMFGDESPLADVVEEELSFTINDGAASTAAREVDIHFSGSTSDIAYVKFTLNHRNANGPGMTQQFSQDMSVRISSYRDVNYVNAWAYNAAGDLLTSTYASIIYDPPNGISISMNAGNPRSRGRDISLDFSGDLADVAFVSFSVNSTDPDAYGPLQAFSNQMNVRIPNYRGQNYINMWFHNAAGRKIAWQWRRIEYIPLVDVNVAFNDGDSVSRTSRVRLDLSGADLGEVAHVKFAINSTNPDDYGPMIPLAPQIEVDLPVVGTNYINIWFYDSLGRAMAWRYLAIDYVNAADPLFEYTPADALGRVDLSYALDLTSSGVPVVEVLQLASIDEAALAEFREQAEEQAIFFVLSAGDLEAVFVSSGDPQHIRSDPSLLPYLSGPVFVLHNHPGGGLPSAVDFASVAGQGHVEAVGSTLDGWSSYDSTGLLQTELGDAWMKGIIDSMLALYPNATDGGDAMTLRGELNELLANLDALRAAHENAVLLGEQTAVLLIEGNEIENEVPEAVDQIGENAVQTQEDVPVEITLTANNPEVEDELTYTIYVQPSHGLIDCENENCIYTPDANYHGTDSFQFEVSDGIERETTFLYHVIDPESPSLGALSNFYSLTEILNPKLLIQSPVMGENITGTVLSIDYAIANESEFARYAYFQLDDGPIYVDLDYNGHIEIPGLSPRVGNADDPDGFGHELKGWLATDSFNAIRKSGTSVSFDSGINSPPRIDSMVIEGADDNNSDEPGTQIQSGTVVTFDPTISDSDSDFLYWGWYQRVDNHPEVLISSNDRDLLRQPTLTFDSAGAPEGSHYEWIFRVRDRSSMNAAGVETVEQRFSYDITGNPNGVSNIAPSAISQIIAMSEDGTTSFNLTGFDLNGDVLTYAIIPQAESPNLPQHGSVSCSGTSCLYRPNEDYNGTDSIAFTINDGLADSNVALITFEIDPVNDGPVIETEFKDSDGNPIPDDDRIVASGGEEFSVIAGETTTITLIATDVDGDPINFLTPPDSVWSGLAGFSVSIDNTDGTATLFFRPQPGDEGIYPISLYAADVPFGETVHWSFNLEVLTPDDVADPIMDPITVSNIGAMRADIAWTTDEPADTQVEWCDADDTDGTTCMLSQKRLQRTIGHQVSLTDLEMGKTYKYRLLSKDGSGNQGVSQFFEFTTSLTNTAPTISTSDIVMNEDRAYVMNFDALDADLDPLSYIVTQDPANGTVSCSINLCMYVPGRNYFGSDFFVIQSSDGLLSSPATRIDVEVVNVYDAPEITSMAATNDVRPHQVEAADIEVSYEAIVKNADKVDLTWNWFYRIGTGPNVPYRSGITTGDSPVQDAVFNYQNAAVPSTYTWTLRVSDGTGTDETTYTTYVVGPVTDPVDPPIDPVDPVDPPVDPIDPVDPVDPPVDPIDPVDPVDPVDTVPDVSPISLLIWNTLNEAVDRDPATPEFDVYPTDKIAYAATATDDDNDNLNWSWAYEVNGGSKYYLMFGEGMIDNYVYDYTLPLPGHAQSVPGDEYEWILSVTDEDLNNIERRFSVHVIADPNASDIDVTDVQDTGIQYDGTAVITWRTSDPTATLLEICDSNGEHCSLSTLDATQVTDHEITLDRADFDPSIGKVNIIVTSVNDAPFLAAIPDQTIDEGNILLESLPIDVDVVDADEDMLTYTVNGVPAAFETRTVAEGDVLTTSVDGETLTLERGRLMFDASGLGAGIHRITVGVNDGTVIVNQTFTLQITSAADDGAPFSVSSITTVNNIGEVVDVDVDPAMAGDQAIEGMTVTLSAEVSFGSRDADGIDLTDSLGKDNFDPGTFALGGGTQGNGITWEWWYVVGDGVDPVVAGVEDVRHIHSQGQFFITPAVFTYPAVEVGVPMTYEWILVVRDGTNTIEKNFFIEVFDESDYVNAAPTIQPLVDVTVDPGFMREDVVNAPTIEFVIDAIDPEDGFDISLSMTSVPPLPPSNAYMLPPGPQFDPGTGAFSWFPTRSQVGVYDVTFTATDSWGKSTKTTVTLTVNEPPVCTSSSSTCTLLKEWYADGTAAGNTGDFYDNRDGEHAYTQPPAQMDTTAGTGWAGATVALATEGPIISNSSTSAGVGFDNATSSYLRHQWGSDTLLRLALNNQIHISPEHRSYDPGHNGRKGYGDAHLGNPVSGFITSVGSSGSERKIVSAVFDTLASFHPTVKEELLRNGMMSFVIQTIFRMTNPTLSDPEDYFTGKAHLTAYNQNTELDHLAMMHMAHDMTLSDIPARTGFAVLSKNMEGIGGPSNFSKSEIIYENPNAAAYVHRGVEQTKTFIIEPKNFNANASRPDVNYRFEVLRGDPEKISITDLGDGTWEVRIDYHDRMPIFEGSNMDSNRVDIGIFAENGSSYHSAPAVLSINYLDNQLRTYDAAGNIQEIGYQVGDSTIGFIPQSDYHALLSSYDIFDWPEFIGAALAPAGTLAADLLRSQLSDENRIDIQAFLTTFQPLYDEYKATEAVEIAAKAIRGSSDAANEDWRTKYYLHADARNAAGGHLVSATDRGGNLIKDLMEGALNVLNANPNFYIDNLAAIEALVSAGADASKVNAFIADRQDLIDLGIMVDNGDGTYGIAAASPNGLSRYELRRLEQFHVSIMNNILYPDFVNRRNVFNENWVHDDIKIAAPGDRDVFNLDGSITRYEGANRTTLVEAPEPVVNEAPIANSQSVSLAQDTSIVITLSGTDADSDDTALIYARTEPSHGTLTDPSDGISSCPVDANECMYTPDAGYTGSDSFIFQVDDGTDLSNIATISITVT